MVGSAIPTPGANGEVAISELGALGVRHGGGWSSVRGERSSVLLAALALGGRGGVRTETLMEAIWPSPDRPASARQSLANFVSRWRLAYGDEFVESFGNGYRLGNHVQSDRQRFVDEVRRAQELTDLDPDAAIDLAERALLRWRGDPWVGLERPDGVAADRAHLLERHASAQKIRLSCLLALGRPAEAVPQLREMVEADPFDELARNLLVQALSDTGQRAEALRTIQEARREFSKRGLVLDAALVGVEQRLLSAEFMFDAQMEPLPEQTTDFVGRDRESAEIADALQISRLVTLHGLGGSGKTRLAVHVASRMSGPEKCGFVDLVGARSHAQVELAFARGLGLPFNRLDGLDTDERREALADAATVSAGVLVVDNCEHVLHDVRAVVGGLLARPGRLRILATSRVPLEIAGEYRYPIPEFIHGTELFMRRSALRGMPIEGGQHADLVAEICELVEQLPLAIEIAAAQTPYRTIHEIADELGRGIAHRDATQPEPRHETMSATIRWSHELLDTEPADALVKLGVFDSPFQRADAAAVIESEDTSNGLLDTFVRNSLVERLDHDGSSTYRLPHPVQQYCAAELERRGTATEVAIALADWLLEFTDRPYGDVWWRLSVIDEIRIRLPHALAAIAALQFAGRIDDATRLASRFGGAAHLYGHADDLIEVLTELWPGCGDAEATADALLALVLCADVTLRQEFMPSLGLLAAIEGAAGRRHRVYVHCLHSLLSMMAARLTDGDYGPARHELNLAREIADARDTPINRAHIEQWQSGIHLLEGDWSAAEASARRSLDDSAGTRVDVTATSCLCHARLQLGDPDMALDLATSHPHRNLDTAFGDRLGLVAAIARIQRGDTRAGLAEISQIQQKARESPWAVQQDDLAIAIAYAAHLLDQDGLTLQILQTGVVGFGPWIGYLVPKMCRDLGIPITRHYNRTDAERRSRSDHYGTTASRVLNELNQRRGIP
jgi:predicted ATPase/DNA-binding SARP family transcriptional activator